MSDQAHTAELLLEAEQEEAGEDETELAETEAWAIVATFDARLTEAERRIDRVLARLDMI